MSNSASKKQCTIKRKMAQTEKELGDPNLESLCADPAYKEFNKMDDEFSKGPHRHGNNRHYYAKMKVKERKIDRCREKQKTTKQIREGGTDD